MFNEIYKCEKCGTVFDDCHNIFEDGDVYLDERWEMPSNLRYGECPYCGHDSETTVELCSICHQWHDVREMRGGVCPDCINRYRNDREACFEIAQNTPREETKLNAFLLSLFTTAEIEDILIKHARDNNITDCDTFIDCDDDWFGEQICLREGAQCNA